MAIAQAGRRVPALKPPSVLGSLEELRADYLGTIVRAARDVGGIVQIDAGPPGWRSTFYSVSAPDLVPQILGRPDRFTKAVPAYRELRQAFGDGMLTSEGETWLRQRRFLAPIFTPRRISSTYAGVIAEEAQQLVRRWRTAATSGLNLDVHAEMIELTSRIIGRILFGAEMTETIPQIMRSRFINDALVRRVVTRHPIPTWVPTRENRRLRAGLSDIRAAVTDLIAARQATVSDGGAEDMLGLLLAARDGENAKDRLTAAEVADQVLIFMLAGHDTTATTLACLLVELARQPHWQQLVHAELDEVVGPGMPAVEHLARLSETRRVVREGMRLYPAAHSLDRSSAQDEVIGGFRIPAGMPVIVSPWALHRSPDVWTDPETFDPLRFDADTSQPLAVHKYAWIPFGAGPHACVAAQLVMVEVPLVLATITQAFTLTTPLPTTPLLAAMTVRPAGPLPVVVSNR